MHSSNPSAGPPNDGRSPGPWHTGLFDCFEDLPNSCAASATIFGILHYFCLCNGGCLYSCCYRSKLRNQYALVGSRCADCCVHCCCLSCALSQEYRELKKQGFDMSIGWEGHVGRKRHEMQMAGPMAQGGMTR